MRNIKELIAASHLPARDATIVWADILRQDKAYVLTHSEYKPSISEALHWHYRRYKLLRGWSVAHVLKHKEFFSLRFRVNRHTLIPRPDTEVLVETALEILNTMSSKTVVLDVGTGSGCIVVALAKHNPTPTYYASDISRPALRIAKTNASLHQTKINWHCGSLLSPYLSADFWQSDYHNVIIAANLPYLTKEQVDMEPSIQKEPLSALVSGPDGLDAYRALLTQLAHLNPKAKVNVLMEIDPAQTNILGQYISNTLPNWKVFTKTDLQGRDRLIVVSNY